jgi:hypothetical protein
MERQRTLIKTIRAAAGNSLDFEVTRSSIPYNAQILSFTVDDCGFAQKKPKQSGEWWFRQFLLSGSADDSLIY